MPRYITDQYELPDDDDLFEEGFSYRRQRPMLVRILPLLFAMLLVIGGERPARWPSLNARSAMTSV